MFILTVILAVLVGGGFMAFGFMMFGSGKLADQKMRLDETRDHLGVSEGLWKAIGALEIAGAVGVLIGLLEALPIIGVLAGIGLVAMTTGAVFYHHKAGDPYKDRIPATVMGALVIFYIIARIASA
jgi:uncharacterized membrane protein YphA (DoxX/SURF4 family)